MDDKLDMIAKLLLQAERALKFAHERAPQDVNLNDALSLVVNARDIAKDIRIVPTGLRVVSESGAS